MQKKMRHYLYYFTFICSTRSLYTTTRHRSEREREKGSVDFCFITVSIIKNKLWLTRKRVSMWAHTSPLPMETYFVTRWRMQCSEVCLLFCSFFPYYLLASLSPPSVCFLLMIFFLLVSLALLLHMYDDDDVLWINNVYTRQEFKALTWERIHKVRSHQTAAAPPSRVLFTHGDNVDLLHISQQIQEIHLNMLVFVVVHPNLFSFTFKFSRILFMHRTAHWPAAFCFSDEVSSPLLSLTISFSVSSYML